MGRAGGRRGAFAARVALVASVVGLGAAATVPAAGQSRPHPVVTLFPHQLYVNPVAITADAGDVWVLDNGGGAAGNGAVDRIDPSTGRRTVISSPLFHLPNGIFAAGPAVWITSLYPTEPHTMLKLTVATDRITRVTSRAFDGPTGVVSRGRYLWILNDLGGSVVTRLDTATGAVTSNTSVETAGEDAIAVDSRYVWVGGARLLRFSSTTSSVVHVDPSTFTDVHALASDGTHLWALQGNRHLLELTIATGAVRSYFNPQFEFANQVATNGRFVWLTDNYEPEVLVLDVATGRFTTVRSPEFSKATLYAAVAAGSNAWVTLLCHQVVNGAVVGCAQVAKISP